MESDKFFMSMLENSRRIVVKVGTSTLTHATGALNIRRIGDMVRVLSDFKNAGKDIGGTLLWQT